MKISKDNVITINNIEYQVLKTTRGIDFYDSRNEKIIGEHLEIDLHKIGSKVLHPTHCLKLYHNKEKDAKLFKIKQEKPPEYLTKIKSQGHILTYYDKQSIPLENIKIVK